MFLFLDSYEKEINYYLKENMASTSPAANSGTDVSRSKSLPWFQSKIGNSLTPAGQQLLEQYSDIDPSEVENHIYKIVGVSKLDNPATMLFADNHHSVISHGRFSPGLASANSGSSA